MRPFIVIKVLQAAALLLISFVLLRVVGPWLVDLHKTSALILAAALLIGEMCLVGWFLWSVVAPRRPR